MRIVTRQAVATCLVRSLAALLIFPSLVAAEQLPIKIYTTAEGLAQDNVNRIVRDSLGFLWFCTSEGLSRFDGYQFTTYTTDQGLPDRRVYDLLETRSGTYWVATGRGVCRFDPAGSDLFVACQSSNPDGRLVVEVLAEDSGGAVWCGTRGGLYRLQETAGQTQLQSVDIGLRSEAEGNVVQAIVADRLGTLWIGTLASGLYRRWADGRVEHYTTRSGLSADRVEALLEDRSGRVWAGTSEGLAQLVPAPDPNQPAVAHFYTTADGLAANFIDSLFQSADGRLWVGSGGLNEFIPGPSPDSRKPRTSRGSSEPGDPETGHFRAYTTTQGLSSSYVRTLAEDRDGNLWLGTDSGGAMKLARTGFTTYTEGDGLGAAGADAIFEDRAGKLCVISSGGKHLINRFDGRRFTAICPDFPKQITNFGWGWNQVAFQDHAGEWWVPTGQGLCRFPAVAHFEDLAHTSPRALYTTREGLAFNDVFRLFEDSHGDIWISTLSQAANGLSRWERATQTLQSFSEADGLTPLTNQPVVAFCEDHAGNLWIGHWGSGLTRRAGNRFRLFSEADGVPAGTIRALYLDRGHRLWIASSLGGLACLADPTSDHPSFVTYTTGEGLSSNDVWCVTEDRSGHLYVGTGRGVDRLDPGTGHIKHYTAADGLMRGKVTTAFRDRHGVLWFGSNVHGLSRFVPGPEPPPAPPPILITGVRIAGVPRPLSQLGETGMLGFKLGPNQNQLTIDFVGLSFGPGDVLHYQYQLEGADRDWSPPGAERSVNYANLAPGRYRFLVRAVNDDGLVSVAPATAAFTILPPIWQRWWFLTLAGFFAGLAFYVAHRWRVARLVELERVRTRIATDLHDDIGANLSLVAMLSEVACGELGRGDPRLRDWFSTIAATSRDTVDAMSDIVWAVNPRRDQFSDLTQRMRRFAEEIFGARDIELHFVTPDADHKLGADLRREVFLIFKESVNNVVRHSGCTAARVELEIGHGWLELKMSDNGRGFDAAHTRESNGLASMRSRAKKLRGTLDVESSVGHGTVVKLRVPLDHRGATWLFTR